MKPAEKPKKTILLIDDQESTLKTYSSILEEDYDYHVIPCASFEEGLEAARNNRASIDYVVSDLSTSDNLEAGFAFCRKLQFENFTCPIIMQTNGLSSTKGKSAGKLLAALHDNSELEQKAKLSGVTMLIEKGNIQTLRGALEAVDKQRALGG